LRGRFITLEGPEGSGKSTQAKLLAEALAARGIRTELTREPGGTDLAEELRKLLKHWRNPAEQMTPAAELMLMNAARAQHVAYRIQPALDAGKWVICDRFRDSTMAYQGYGRGMDKTFISATSAAACQGCTIDRTLFFDLALDEGFARADRRASTAGNFDRFEIEDRDFHERVLAGFRAMTEAEPERFRRIDASGTPEEIHCRVMEAICDLLP